MKRLTLAIVVFVICLGLITTTTMAQETPAPAATETDNNTLIIMLIQGISSVIFGVMLYHSVPKSEVTRLLTRAQGAAATTPTQWDDLAVSVGKTVIEALQKQNEGSASSTPMTTDGESGKA